MIINGKYVQYDWTREHDIMHIMLKSRIGKMIENMMRPNAIFTWAFGREDRTRAKYAEGTINADLIHDWLPEDRIYRG